jgi:hypothetical protein
MLYDSKHIMTEWQRLMERWELAYADYATLRAKGPMRDGQERIQTGELELAERNLVEIKHRIDDLIGRGAVRAQAASPDEMRFALIESKMANFTAACLEDRDIGTATQK